MLAPGPTRTPSETRKPGRGEDTRGMPALKPPEAARAPTAKEAAAPAERGKQMSEAGAESVVAAPDDMSPDPTAFEAQRADVEAALAHLDAVMAAFIDACQDWQVQSWSKFIGGCGGNPVLGMTAAEYHALCMGLVGVPDDVGGLGVPAEAGAEKTAAQEAVGHGVNTAMGMAVASTATLVSGASKVSTVLRAALGGTGVPGLVVGVLVNAAWDLISGLLYPDDEPTPLAVSTATAAATASVSQRLLGAASKARAEWTTKHGVFASSIAAATATSELDVIGAEVGSAIVGACKPTGEGLSAALTARWVAQHSATPSKAGAGTDAASWKTAKDTQTLAGRKDLFLEQCCYLWALYGLDVTAPKAHLERLYRPLAHLGAEAIAAGVSGHETTLGLPTHGDMFAAQLPDPDRGLLNDPVTRPEDIVGATRARGYDLSCVPSLKVADGAVVLATMAFDLRPKAGHDAEGEACHDGDRAAVRARSWQRGPE